MIFKVDFAHCANMGVQHCITCMIGTTLVVVLVMNVLSKGGSMQIGLTDKDGHLRLKRRQYKGYDADKLLLFLAK